MPLGLCKGTVIGSSPGVGFTDVLLGNFSIIDTFDITKSQLLQIMIIFNRHQCDDTSLQTLTLTDWTWHLQNISWYKNSTITISLHQMHLGQSSLKPTDGWSNIKMFHRYRKSFCRDKVILQLSYLYNSYTDETSVYWTRVQYKDVSPV